MAGLKLNPRDKMSLNARAQALNRLGRYQEALAASRQASSANSRNSFARYMEAVAHSGLGDRGGMLSALQAAGKIDTRYQEIYEAALQAPQDSDMALLFPQEKSMVAASRRGMRWAAVLAAALAGGGLLAFGFFRLAFVPLRSAFTRARPGPARGQYKTLKQIGAGGMGMVYEGKDVSLDRRVAIKKMREEIRLDGRQRERFITEAKLVAALHHPNVVDIYSIIDEGDELALVFEFVSGKTLHQLICERRRLGLPEAMAIFKGVAGALDYAHGRGIIHRDLKPSNIMITDEGAAKVMDFGIARAAKDALARQSMTNTVVGTPPYMAPEQEQGVVRRESDVYALAVCFYEMICGQLPFSGSGGGMLMSKINKSYVAASRVVPGLPESLDAVIDRALDPDPERRYRCAQDLLAGLESGSVSSAV